jgi:hypothetical protein
VTRFGQPAYCLAWESKVDELGDFSIGILHAHGRLEDRDVTARMGDAISEEDDSIFFWRGGVLGKSYRVQADSEQAEAEAAVERSQ